MIFLTNEDIYLLVRSFEDRTIKKSEWTHSAHLAIGLFYLRILPFAVAKNVLRDGIYWLNDKHGTPNTDDSGYHETLTVFWLKRIWNFLDERDWTNAMAPLANELISQFRDPNLPLRFYTKELLYSPKARRDYCPPDLETKKYRRISTQLLTISP
ncbi:MAG TPA: hypothetical protein VJL58_10940, partial [Pyrinomonadaceae bacterium]|nr:hypothetical protein [Pyrinomonadaceae bacterium]